jgi:hypothetical protein
MKRIIPFIVPLLIAAALMGCGARRDETKQARLAKSPFPKDESEYVAMIVIDNSSSFQKLMAEDGHAYTFICAVISKYFRDRIGSEKDQILLVQISGSQKSIMWQGTPEGLRRRFASKNSFRDFLVNNAGPDGSLIHENISHALEHMMRMPNVASGKAKSVLLILSDLDDNGPNPEQSEKRLFDDLIAYFQKGGHAGFYYADQLKMEHWRKKLTAAGYPLVPIVCKENDSPALPDFE